MAARDKPKTKPINLALQGGGAIGAFTWGVLDALLEDGRLWLDCVSGTSGGAMNAVALGDGPARDGADGARRQLERFWSAVSTQSATIAAFEQGVDLFTKMWRLPAWYSEAAIRHFAPLASPYTLNPFNYNPLAALVEGLIDFDRMRREPAVELHLSATSVRTGKTRVFTGDEIDARAVMASACLPYLFQAIEIDGEAYWDGGYSGNPPLWPLYRRHHHATDILIVQLDPMVEEAEPTTPAEVAERMRELTFNNSLLHEMRAIQFVNTLLDKHSLDSTHYRKKRLHRIDASRSLLHGQVSRTFDISWQFIGELREAGRDAAHEWLAKHFDDVGVRSTVDIDAELI